MRKIYNIDNNSTDYKKREDIEDKYKWNITDIYSSKELWENDILYIEQKLVNYQDFENKLSQKHEILYQLLQFDEDLSIRLERIHLYSMLNKDIDLSNNNNLSDYDRVMNLYSKLMEAKAFIIPEILSIPENTLFNFIKENDKLKLYEHHIKDIIRTKQHTLSKNEERIMALASNIMEVPSKTFSIYDNADIEFPIVKDPQGNDYQITHGRYGVALRSQDRKFRETVYKEFYKPYKSMKNTLASLFSGQLNTLNFNSKVRNYNSSLEAALDQNNIPNEVYYNLIETVKKNVGVLHRWAKIKKQVLNYDQLHPYDTYVTLFPEVDKNYKYDESINILLESFRPLGEQYLFDIKKAMENRWIDVYETKNKRSGAYSSGTTFGVHPYVLLNWNDQLNDVFTFAHEMGHNMHSYYTGKKQPYVYANYSIFTAEVASTLNEALLLDYLIKNAKSKREKLSLIEMNLTNIQTTFFRQTRFAEFELLTNKKLENGEPLTSDNLSKLFGDLYQEYWGSDMFTDEEEALSWARIPHFYYNFYVYQYATSYAASQALVEKIINNENDSVNKYLEFLSNGSSLYPIDLLKETGVDMTNSNPIEAVIRKMNNLLNELERLI